MEIRVLRYFIAVVQEESITRAANILHITQPTLSRQLSDLEDELGAKLFSRGARGITLTEDGMLLYRRATEIVSLADRTETEIFGKSANLEGKISIGTGESASVKRLAEICGAFQEKYPLVTFDIVTAAADMVMERLDKGLLDIGLLIEPIDISKYDFIRMDVSEEWGLFMRSDDTLAKSEGISAETLGGIPLIAPKRVAVRSEVLNWIGGDYGRLNVRFTSNLSTNSCMLMNRGLGYSLALRDSMPFADASQIVFRPLLPPLYSTSVLAWKRQQTFTRAAARFIETARVILRGKNGGA